MSTQDIRWEQRLQNYKKTMVYLETALEIEKPDLVQKAGIIHFFEMSFELARKLLKDYLEAQGFQDVKSPRAALKTAFEVGLIPNGHDWLDLLVDRNLTSHIYDEEKATEMEALIHQKYFPIMKELLHHFNQNIHEG